MLLDASPCRQRGPHQSSRRPLSKVELPPAASKDWAVAKLPGAVAMSLPAHVAALHGDASTSSASSQVRARRWGVNIRDRKRAL
jgi:hypothetical protein